MLDISLDWPTRKVTRSSASSETRLSESKLTNLTLTTLQNPSNTSPHHDLRSCDSFSDLKDLGATPTVISLEDAPIPDLTALLTTHKPDAVIFAAGAGGKGDKSRTQKVDYEGAVKVFDAMESSNVKRLLYVGAIDIRSREKGWPEHYNDDSSEFYQCCVERVRLIGQRSRVIECGMLFLLVSLARYPSI